MTARETTPQSRPYRELGPFDWTTVSFGTPYGSTDDTLTIELQCEDCEQVYDASWTHDEIGPDALAFLATARWLREHGGAGEDLSPEDAAALYALLPARSHGPRDCVRFVRDLATGRAYLREPNQETEDW
jgi:hypothetical protein